MRRARPTLALLAALCAAPAGARSQSVAGLPLVEAPATRDGRALAVFLSGDGGWAGLTKDVTRVLVDSGVAVVGFDSRAFISRHRSPDDVAQAVGRVIEHYTAAWHRDRVILIGYSRGAELAPFAATRLPEALRRRVELVALLAPAERAGFEFHLLDMVRTRSRQSDVPLLPEIERLRDARVLCVYGRDEAESLCRTAPAGLMQVVARPGKHHFDGDYRALAQLILSAAPER